MQVWELIIASGIIGLVFTFGQQLIMWKLNRKAEKEDRAETAHRGTHQCPRRKSR